MAKRNDNTEWRFEGFVFPTTTPVPDQVFDELVYHLSGAELKVLLYIIRRTFGFKKISDNISLNQLVNGITKKDGTVLDRGTGLNKDTVINGVKQLEQKGIILATRRTSQEKGHEPTTYSLNLRYQAAPLSENPTRVVGKIRPALVGRTRQEQQTVIGVRSTLEQKIGSLRCLGDASPVTERPFSLDRSIWECAGLAVRRAAPDQPD